MGAVNPVVFAHPEQDLPMQDTGQISNDMFPTQISGSHKDPPPHKFATTRSDSVAFEMEMGQDIDPLVAWLLDLSAESNSETHNAMITDSSHQLAG